MSFDAIISSVAPRTETIEIEGVDAKGNKKVYVFTAKEVPHVDRMDLISAAVSHNKTGISALIQASIYDEADKPMTIEQARKLPATVVSKFLDAALNVNKAEESEKN